MFVRDYMTRHPIMVEPATSMIEAQGIMSEARIRHLPVIEKGKRLVGLLTRARLRIPPTDLASLNMWEISRFLSNLKVRDLMVRGKDVVTIGPDATIEDAAQTMAANKIGCLPVLEEGIVVGIITEQDLLVHLAGLLGSNISGVRATIRTPDRIGEFAKIAGAIAARGWGIYASGGLPSPKRPGFWDVVIRVRNVSREDLLSVLNGIEGQEVIDVRDV
jgi:acetoin utilization protein AcuB